MTLRKKCAIELAVHDARQVGHPILHCYSFDTKITIYYRSTNQTLDLSFIRVKLRKLT